jgi:hypothetical protein
MMICRASRNRLLDDFNTGALIVVTAELLQTLDRAQERNAAARRMPSSTAARASYRPRGPCSFTSTSVAPPTRSTRRRQRAWPAALQPRGHEVVFLDLRVTIWPMRAWMSGFAGAAAIVEFSLSIVTFLRPRAC